MNLRPNTRALLAVVCFSLALLAGLLFTAGSPSSKLPMGIFYALLIVNTYFSVKLFGAITVYDRKQNLIDCVLFLFYLGMAFSVGKPALFAFLLAVFFAVATLKYVFMLGAVPHPQLLKRKITADILGTMFGLAVFGGVVLGYETFSLWAMAAVFGLANVGMFFVYPLYRLDGQS